MNDLGQMSGDSDTTPKATTNPHHQYIPFKVKPRAGVEHVSCPDVTQKSTDHAGHSAKSRAAHCILRQTGQARRHEHEQGQNPNALALLNQGAKYENPNRIVKKMQKSKVNKHGRKKPPNFSLTNFGQAGVPTPMNAINMAVTGDAENIRHHPVGSEIGKQDDGK